MTSNEALQRLTQPTGRRWNRRASNVGDGPACPANPKHGAMLKLRSGTQFCPHQTHDVERLTQRRTVR